MKLTNLFFVLLVSLAAQSQTNLQPLTVEKIMRDPKWIGTSPSRVEWDINSRNLYFYWNPEKASSDSQYVISLSDHTPRKTSLAERQVQLTESDITYNGNKSAYVYARNGDIFLVAVKTGAEKQITHTVAIESNPFFAYQDKAVVYVQNQNYYSWDMATGTTTQLSNFQSQAPQAAANGGFGNFQRGNASRNTGGRMGVQEKWLSAEALETSEILRERKEKREEQAAAQKAMARERSMKAITSNGRILFGETLSADGRYVGYRLFERNTSAKSTIVPRYVTESGFTEDIPGRTKVGAEQGSSDYYILDCEKDSTYKVDMSQLPGITDIPAYIKDYPKLYEKREKDKADRAVDVNSALWSPAGSHLVLNIYAQDNKDRWIVLLDPASGKMKTLDRQHDDAWIGGPGISGFGGRNMGWINESVLWFQSEATGYSHLYTVDVESGARKALTSGKFEVQRVQLSNDHSHFYFTSNEVHPGEQQFYSIPVTGGQATRLTTMTGANEVTLSPDEKWLAILYSYSNKPWELYIQPNKAGARPVQITHQAASAEFNSYPWRDPEVITFKASDGATVYARLYKPEKADPAHPAVIFVHGAGYLQNAHKWWSSYFREYMFNNLLADHGYTVLDIDYRGSAGYGRDWRTGIYRYMGGKDLSDQVDGAKFLVSQYAVNPKHIGMYGGSYGGFMTLMAMFTEPGVFASGAALRSVTDWAHYNHGYTSNILNEPVTDSIAYHRSSPIFFAEGLQGNLLMCHGMIDVNVHFQDIVRLTQRLIELHKENWELAVYPLEDHGFVEPSSWTDEYKRIFKLFERTLKN